MNHTLVTYSNHESGTLNNLPNLPSYVKFTVLYNYHCGNQCAHTQAVINTFSAMADFKHHIIVSCTYLGIKELN